MARVKNTAPLAPSRFYRGLAGETFLDPAFQNRVHPTPDYHCRRGFETASSIRDSNVVAVRPLRWLTPPPVAAREPGEGNGEGRAVHDQEAGVAAAVEEGIAPPHREKRKVSVLPSPRSVIARDPGAKIGVRKRKASLLSSSSPGPQDRIIALEATLQILQEKHEMLEYGLMMKKRRSEIGGTELLDEPEKDDSGGGVVFVHHNAKEKGSRQKIARTT